MADGSAIAEGTSVRGVDIGGLTPEAAQATLDEQLAEARSATFTVRIGEDAEETYEVDPIAAGLGVDLRETVEQAERPGFLGRLFGRSGGELDPVTTVEEPKARAELEALAEESGSEPQEGGISFEEGSPVASQPGTGLALDVDAAVEELRTGYLGPAGNPVSLSAATAQPAVDAEEIERAMNDFAEPAMSGPVVLTANGSEIPLTPVTLGDHLSMEPDDEGTLVPVLDGKGLAEDPLVAEPLAAATDPAVNATLRLEGEEVVVATEGKPGREVTSDGLEEAVMPLLTETGAARTGPVSTVEVQPELTSGTITELGITERMSSFTVGFDTAAYRTTNIGRAAELIDGSLVPPGETWSFNDTIGRRTEENGFVEGIIILDDQYQTAQGGGVSAVATTMFNAVFFAGVKPVEYSAHSFYIERYPEGRESTVAWGSLDHRFLNDSDHALYIMADATDSEVTITFLGTKKYDEIESVTGPRTNIVEPGKREAIADDCVPQPPLEGFDVEVERVFKQGGEEVKRESFTTRYQPRDEVVCEDEDD
ncbi:VanW family protein [Streptomyces sp. ACA25]|nr:VanW family protein [Streptomyces sp. ACA25]MDB1089064.1 VanW family protein [Streptomyces sp. ACA25]